jgi:hypothetical protein
MNSNSESVLAAELQDLAGVQPFAPDLDAITRRGRALRRRRIVLAGAGGSVAAVGVAAIVAVAALAAGPSGPAGVAAGTPSASVLRAQLMAALSKAKATAKLTVMSTFADKSGASSTSEIVTVPSQKWQELTSWDSAGIKTEVDFATELAGTGRYKGYTEQRTLTLDYPARTFSIERVYSPARDVIVPWVSDNQPESLKNTPWSKVVGTATLHGQPVYILVQTGSGGYSATVWVNKATLLPVKDVVHTFAGTTTDDYTWSSAAGADATAGANTPAIPYGFTRSDDGCQAVPVPKSRNIGVYC